MPGMIRILLPLLLAATPSPPPDATTTVRGLVNTKDQAFSGHKHFDGGIYTPKINGVPVETTAVVSLFVNPTGSDTANCTDVSTPCATINGALARLPRFLKHNVTVTLEPGTYTLASSQTIDAIGMADNVSLTIAGSTAWTQWTPATGTATGTLTGFTPIAFPARAIATDSAQTWPAATPTGAAAALGIRGRFVCFTSGPQLGSKFPISAASPTTLEISRTNFTGGNPATGNTYEICTPSTILTGTVTGLIKIATGTGTINLNDLAFEPSAANIQALTLGASTGGRAGGYAVNLTRVRMRSLGPGGGSAIPMTASGSYTIGVTDSAVIATTANEGGNDSTAIAAGSNTNTPGSTRISFTDVYLRGMRNTLAAAHALLVVNGLTVDSENVTSNVVVSLNNVTATSWINNWVNCYSGEGGSQSAESGIGMIGGRMSVFALQVKGCQIGIDLGNFGNTTQSPANTGAQFVFSGLTSQLNLLNIGQSSPTTGAGVSMGGASVVNLKGGTVTLSTIANGARDYVCPDLTTAYTEAAVQAAGGKFVTCQGSSVQR